MCGIAGFIRSAFPRTDRMVARRMGEAIAHRGPDASGEYVDDFIALAHRRLSIVDLSGAGKQPMVSANGRFIIVFNGEIYNFLEIRSELEKKGILFRSRTDTEIILALYETEGTACLKKLNGMFAFAIWDREEQTLFLARDRIGKKPLYYYHGGGDRLAFASEIKALMQISDIPLKLNKMALLDYMKYLHVPAPNSIFESIFKLLPGHFLLLRLGSIPKVTEYWDVSFSQTLDLSFEDGVKELFRLINASTVQRMISDVPIGAFLSGGIDSSVVVGAMAQQWPGNVTTCSVGFGDRRHDESKYARQIATLFKTDHHEYSVNQNMADTIRILPKFFDEPFADSSAVPTYHVAQLARKSVTVALTGDGGDESFGGYQRYVTEIIENSFRSTLPRFLLQSLLNIAGGDRSGLQRKISTLFNGALSEPALGFYRTNSHIGDEEMSRLLSPMMKSVCRDHDPFVHTKKYWDKVRDADHVTRMLYTEIKSTLPDGIMVKVDRMSMAHSLEVRSPLLDYRIIEFAATLPSRWKIRNGEKKYILKKAATLVLPQNIIHRKKQGFTVPLDRWFRKDLQELTKEALLQDRGMSNFFCMKRLSEIYEDHLYRNRDHSTLLWMLLSFALWWREYASKIE